MKDLLIFAAVAGIGYVIYTKVKANSTTSNGGSDLSGIIAGIDNLWNGTGTNSSDTSGGLSSFFS